MRGECQVRAEDQKREIRSRACRLVTVAAAVAIALLVSACGNSPSASSPANSASSCPTLLSSGLAAQGQESISAATTDYTEVISLCPGTTNAAYAFYDLGVVEQVNDGDAAAAETDYQSALAIDPNQADALYNLAIVLTKSNPNEAIDDYTRAIALYGANDVASASSYLNRGFVEISLGRVAAGHADQGKAVHLDPSLKSRIK